MRKSIAVLVAAALLPLVAAVRPAEAAPRLRLPGPDVVARRRRASLRLDADKLQSALDFATQHTSATVLVLRHGCLAGASRLDALTSKVPLDGWSMTKSVTALLVGRAVTLGKLDIDRPIARLFPEADRAHGRLTPRHLLTMSSGLHLNWLRDLNPAMPDRVRDALSLASDHAPGTWWAYQQSPVTLLAEVVRRAVEADDLHAWANAQLFTPIGIARDQWFWQRDRAGTHRRLGAPVDDVTRLGAPRVPRPARRRAGTGGASSRATTCARCGRRRRANHAYGFLTWLNGRDSYVMPGTNGRDEGRARSSRRRRTTRSSSPDRTSSARSSSRRWTWWSSGSDTTGLTISTSVAASGRASPASSTSS